MSDSNNSKNEKQSGGMSTARIVLYVLAAIVAIYFLNKLLK